VRLEFLLESSVRTQRIADRTHGFHLDRVHSGRISA
jgi:hypothetical protein